jgi:hypothetical protein
LVENSLRLSFALEVGDTSTKSLRKGRKNGKSGKRTTQSISDGVEDVLALHDGSGSSGCQEDGESGGTHLDERSVK